ncbi:MAG TPA: DUF5723 family protein [Longimicrobiaceae bacterium]|nr:DUF5723 family protein [Longimicrobiaceae bacterium]
MKLPRRTGALLGASLALAAFAAPAAAQVPLAPRALGLGGAYVGTARGHEALFANPANLGLSGNPAWSLGFPQVAAGLNLLGPRVGDLPDFFNYDDLTDERKSELLAAVPASGTALEADVRAPLVTYQNGRLALGVAYGLRGEHTVGRDLVDLFLNGYQEGRTTYQVGNTRGRRATFWDFAAGYGTSAGPLSVGATAHYYLGRSLVQTRAFEPRYDLQARDIEVDYVGVGARGGRGWGLDLGAALGPVRGLTVSAVVANALGSMEWSDERTGKSVTLTRADFREAELQFVRNRYDQSEQDLGSDPTGAFAAAAVGLTENATLPTTLRVGAAWALPGVGTTLTAAFHDDLSEGRLAGRWTRLLGGGVQQKLPVGTVRVGFSSDLEDGSMASGGLTLGPVDLAAARFTTGDASGGERNGWIGSFGLSVRAY